MSGFAPVWRLLALPVYLPTLAQAIGFTAMAPVLPLIALDLGFSVAASAALGLITGLLGVLGPVPAGRAITVLGERPAMLITGVVLTAVFVGGWWLVADALTAGPHRLHRLGLIMLLVFVGVGQQVWALARQAHVGGVIDPSLRARAMSTFGGMMRIGQVIGPVLGATVVVRWGVGSVFALAALAMGLATLLVGLFLVPSPPSAPETSLTGAVLATEPHQELRWWREPVFRRMVLVALGTAPLQMARITRPVVLPLVGAQLGLGAPTVSLLFGIAAAIEIIMVIPAGSLMDRYGRTMVLVPCLTILGAGYLGLAVAAVSVGARSWTWAMLTVGGAAIVLALGNGLGAGIVMTLALDLSPEADRARHLGRWMTLTGAGPLLGPALVSSISLVAPVATAGAALGMLCLAGGAWMLRVLPSLTPVPPAGPFARHR